MPLTVDPPSHTLVKDELLPESESQRLQVLINDRGVGKDQTDFGTLEKLGLHPVQFVTYPDIVLIGKDYQVSGAQRDGFFEVSRGSERALVRVEMNRERGFSGEALEDRACLVG